MKRKEIINTNLNVMRKIFCAQRLPWGPLLCQISHPMGSFWGAASHPLGSFWGLHLLEYEVECRCTLFISSEIIRSRFVVWNICRPSTHFPFEDRKVACREATCQCQRIWTLLLFQCRPQWPWMKTKYLVMAEKWELLIFELFNLSNGINDWGY